MVGRAAISLGKGGLDLGLEISVGGLVYGPVATYAGRSTLISGLGVLEGETNLASRSNAISSVGSDVIAKWATEQAELCQGLYLEYSLSIKIARTIIRLGENSCNLPVCVGGKGLLDINQFRDLVFSSN